MPAAAVYVLCYSLWPFHAHTCSRCAASAKMPYESGKQHLWCLPADPPARIYQQLRWDQAGRSRGGCRGCSEWRICCGCMGRAHQGRRQGIAPLFLIAVAPNLLDWLHALSCSSWTHGLQSLCTCVPEGLHSKHCKFIIIQLLNCAKDANISVQYIHLDYTWLASQCSMTTSILIALMALSLTSLEPELTSLLYRCACWQTHSLSWPRLSAWRWMQLQS